MTPARPKAIRMTIATSGRPLALLAIFKSVQGMVLGEHEVDYVLAAAGQVDRLAREDGLQVRGEKPRADCQ